VGWISRGPALTVNYLPNQAFQSGVIFDNRTGSLIVLTRVHVLEPPHSLVRQVGTVMTLWDPPKCQGLCPVYTFPLRPSATATERPVELAPGKRVGVGLDFRFAPCSAVPSASRRGPSRVAVTFHEPGGPMKQQILPLGGSRLLLRIAAGNCG
jgi:hypothetical protein